MTIKIIEGDLLQASEDIIGHQCNTQGVMGSGIALQIKNQFPEAYHVYKELCYSTKNSQDLLGECLTIESRGKYIANLFGQDRYGYGKQHTVINELKRALLHIKDVAKELDMSVALPYKIGSDRGGADWNEVYQMIDEVFSDYEVTLYKFSG